MFGFDSELVPENYDNKQEFKQSSKVINYLHIVFT